MTSVPTPTQKTALDAILTLQAQIETAIFSVTHAQHQAFNRALAARAAGCSWQQIGDQVGLTPTAARWRFSGGEEAHRLRAEASKARSQARSLLVNENRAATA